MKISVVMASYNGQKYILDQIQSILSQLRDGEELIISDDGSTDKTVDLINRIKDDRIKLVFGPSKGVIKNFEFAIKKAENEIIVLSDQDDVWINNRLEKIRNEFMGINNSLVYISNYELIDNNGEKINIKNSTFHKGIIRNLVKNSYVGALMAFSSELRTDIIPFPKKIAMHDQWIGLMNEIKGGHIFYSKSVEVQYRRHDSNLTGRNKKLTNVVKIRNRINMTKFIIERAVKRRYLLKWFRV